MQTIMATAMGAAAMKLLNRKKPPQDVEALRKQERRLKQELDTLQRELEAKKSLDAAELEALRKQAEDLRLKADELERQNVVLKDDVAQAGEREQQLLLHAGELAQQMETLKEEHASEVQQFQQQLDRMRSAVADVVSRMLAHSISDTEAVEAVRALGCELEFIEAPVREVEQLTQAQVSDDQSDQNTQLTWSVTQSGLLLEDKDRLQRLVVSGMMRNLEASGAAGATARIPVITFPAGPAASHGLAPSGSAKLLTRAASTAAKTLVSVVPIADVSASSQRDQQQPAGSSTNRVSRPPPVITTGTTPKKAPKQTSGGIQWTYALQGGSGSAYVAKMQGPAHGEAAAPAAYLSTGGTPTLLSDSALDDGMDILGGPVPERGLVMKRA